MKCARCGLDLPPNVRQCPKCGLTNEFESLGPKASSKSKPVIIAISALAAVALIALVVGVLARRSNTSIASAPKAPSGPSAGLVTAPRAQMPSGSLMSAPAAKPPATVPNPPAATKPKPPQEVVSYLNFVKKVEDHRRMLLKDQATGLLLSSQVGEAQSLMDEINMASNPDDTKTPDPLKSTKNELNRQYKNWASTLQYFDEMAAPPECRQFSGAYRKVLSTETKEIGYLASSFNSMNIMSLNSMNKLLSGLEKMKSDPSVQGNIDKAAVNANASLNSLVAEYSMNKPFNVKVEQQSGGSLLGF